MLRSQSALRRLSVSSLVITGVDSSHVHCDCPEVIYVLIALLGHGYSLVAELVFGWSPILICRT